MYVEHLNKSVVINKGLPFILILILTGILFSACGKTSIEYIHPGERLELANANIKVVSTKAYSLIQKGNDSVKASTGCKLIVSDIRIKNTSDEEVYIGSSDFICNSNESDSYDALTGMTKYYKDALDDEITVKPGKAKIATVVWEVPEEIDYLEIVWDFEDDNSSYAIVLTSNDNTKYSIYNENNAYEEYKITYKSNIEIDLGSDYVELEYPGSWISWDELKVLKQEILGDEIMVTIAGKGTIYKQPDDHYVEFVNIRAYDKDGYKLTDDIVDRVPHDEGKKLPFKIKRSINMPAETVRAEIYYE